jgi:hypothetical protein
MALRFYGFPLGLGSQRSLSARGQRANTFAGIGFSLALSLLALGGYLIDLQFANPMEAQALELPVAALLIATAIALLYCLLHPFRKLHRRVAVAVPWEETNGTAAMPASRTPQAKDRPLPGRYVDRACIRIQH